MATKEKDRRWDGKSRPSTDLYKKEFNRIFGVKSKEDVKHDHVNKDHANIKDKDNDKTNN